MLIFKAPYQVGTSDMSLSKQSAGNVAGSSGHSYEVLHSQAQEIVCRVYNFLKSMCLKKNEADLISQSVKT
jgi:hypothetical protein